MSAEPAETATGAGSGTHSAGGRRLAALDSLRGLAILLVVAGHYLPGRVVPEPGASALRPFAVGGVVLFFLLSGFLIERNLAREPRPVVYALHRVFRIVPAYWLALVVLVAVHRLLLADPTFGAREVLANALFVPDVLRAPLISGVFWTLLIEAKFYLLAPFLTRTGRAGLVAAPYVVMALNAVIFGWRGEASNILTYLAFCTAGMSFSLWYRGELAGRYLIPLAVCCAVAVALFSPYYKAGLAVFALVDAAALAYALTRGGAIGALSFVGAVSYSWYLYHAGIGYPLMAALEKAPWQLPSAASTAVGVAVTLTVAWLSYRLVERPGIDLGRRLADGAAARSRETARVRESA